MTEYVYVRVPRELAEALAARGDATAEQGETLRRCLAEAVAPPLPPVSDRKPTLGEQRVRVSFNPSRNPQVDIIKHKTAELIDLCTAMAAADGRAVSIALTKYEEAAMWAVKAATA